MLPVPLVPDGRTTSQDLIGPHRTPETAIFIPVTNLLGRLFGEEQRRTKVIPHAFGERAVLQLMYAALIRAAERWRGIRIREFEQRQLKAIREESTKTLLPAMRRRPLRLNRLYPATNGLDPEGDKNPLKWL